MSRTSRTLALVIAVAFALTAFAPGVAATPSAPSHVAHVASITHAVVVETPQMPQSSCTATSWVEEHYYSIEDSSSYKDQVAAWVYYLRDTYSHVFCKQVYVRFEFYIGNGNGWTSFTAQLQINGIPYYTDNEAFNGGGPYWRYTPHYAAADGATILTGYGVHQGSGGVSPTWGILVTP